MGGVRADVPVVTILADFEDDAVAASLGDVQNISPSECGIRWHAAPARGQYCMAMDIGATTAGASVACDLRFREPQRFAQADRVAAFYWLKEGEFRFAFRIRDAKDQVFETDVQTIHTYNQWVRIAAELTPQKLHRVRGDGALTWPIEVQGWRVETDRLGKQVFYLDDLQMEHRAEQREMIHGEFIFNEPTRIYTPGSTVGAKVLLENRSRQEGLQLAVELAWIRPDGSILKTERANVTLPASGVNFRSRQPVDFSQTIDEPGLYQLVARARGSGWNAPNVLQTAVAVTPSNRALQRGRETFFGVRSDLLYEPPGDQRLEIAIAREIGVQLLAVDTPWRLIEPTPGKPNLAALDSVIDALVQKDVDIAPLVVLTGAPAWALPGEQRAGPLTALLVQLAERYGPKVSYYQVGDEIFAGVAWPATVAALEKMQDRLREVRSTIHLISPALDFGTSDRIPSAPELSKSGAGLQWCFRVAGDSTSAAPAEEQERAGPPGGWDSSYWWYHEGKPLWGQTYLTDAEAVLRRYVQAALAGVAGVIWYDLRDNDNDPARPDALRGLTRRDFSPKASLLGYASAAGMLAGLTCRGPVLGTPPEFESALFVGSDRQVAVVLPKPNYLYPAVLAPIQGVPGEISVRDFERRAAGLLHTPDGALVGSLPRPFFITLKLESAQPEPQIAFVRPWLHLPATAFCGDAEPLTVEVEAGAEAQSGAVRLIVPAGAPYEATPVRQSLQVTAGQTATASFRLSPKPEAAFERAGLTVGVNLGARTVEVPIDVRPLVEIRARFAPAGSLTEPACRLAELKPSAGQRATASGTVFGAYDAEQLRLAVRVKDDRFVPLQVLPDRRTTGDDFVIGVAVEQRVEHYEVRVDDSVRPSALVPLAGGSAESGLLDWRCELTVEGDQKERVYEIAIPATALGLKRFEAGLHVQLAVRYVDDDADGFPPVPLMWGQGLDGRRSAADFRWARLGKGEAP